MNKNGAGYIILFFGFMFLMLIIIAGIGMGIVIFFGTSYDFRVAESEILFSLVKDCLDEFEDEVFDEEFSISKCGLNEDVLNDKHLVLIRDLDLGKEFFVGVYDYETQCLLDEAGKSKKFPKCIMRKVGDFEVIVGSGQMAENRRFVYE